MNSRTYTLSWYTAYSFHGHRLLFINLQNFLKKLMLLKHYLHLLSLIKHLQTMAVHSALHPTHPILPVCPFCPGENIHSTISLWQSVNDLIREYHCISTHTVVLTETNKYSVQTHVETQALPLSFSVYFTSTPVIPLLIGPFASSCETRSVVISCLPCLLAPVCLMHPLDKTPMGLTKTPLVWFELTNLAQA